MAWRDKEIIPRYNAGGPATFPTGWFASRDRAYQWLAE